MRGLEELLNVLSRGTVASLVPVMCQFVENVENGKIRPKLDLGIGRLGKARACGSHTGAGTYLRWELRIMFSIKITSTMPFGATNRASEIVGLARVKL